MEEAAQAEEPEEGVQRPRSPAGTSAYMQAIQSGRHLGSSSGYDGYGGSADSAAPSSPPLLAWHVMAQGMSSGAWGHSVFTISADDREFAIDLGPYETPRHSQSPYTTGWTLSMRHFVGH